MTQPNPEKKDLITLRKDVQVCRDLLLANAVMFGEIPAPTFAEDKRVRFMQDRLIEAGCQSVSSDELHNAVGIVPGTDSEAGHVLISGHLDTPFAQAVDHTVQALPNELVGPGILDNSMGLAIIATLPFILEKLNIRFKHNLVLLGSSRSLGFGDIEGIRFFLDRTAFPINAGVVVEGGTLGRLSHKSLGMMRGVINCILPEPYDVMRYGTAGAIPVLNQIITQIQSIRLPQSPATQILLGSMDGGTSFNTVAKQAQLRFEVRSEGPGIIGEVAKSIEEICQAVEASSGMMVSFDQVASRSSGGLTFNHPLVRFARSSLEELGVKPLPVPSTGELAALVERGIPAVTMGMTEGDRRHQFNERVKIEPVFTGIAQLISVLKAIDEGVCDEQ